MHLGQAQGGFEIGFSPSRSTGDFSRASEIRRDDRVLYDSPLEESGFEPSVPLGAIRS
jgi:hypothetical protein